MSSTISNPIDIPYRFSDMSVGPFWRGVLREAADPSVVLFNDHYYLFPSMSGGFWHSADLTTWEFAATPDMPTYDYAPDVREIDGHLVVCASRSLKPCSFFRTADPLGGVWEEIPGTFAFFDPNLFQDDDGRVYLYWGTSNKKPIQGQELDRRTFRPLGKPVAIISGDVAAHGWERPGENHDPGQATGMGALMTRIAGTDPYIEGAWMTKHDGVYYLQYAAPGTQLNTYADGYYTASSPLGPFTYSPQSPFSSKPGGFMTGAGHGSTIQDRHGNWWHMATMRISVEHMFERRIGLFPAGFDADGVLFCNQEFADYPMTVPDSPADPWTLSARAMLLSYRRPVTVSSADPAHGADLAVNEDARTWWVAADAEPAQWICVELAEGSVVSSVQINLADHEVRPPKPKWGDTRQTLVWRRRIDLTEPAVQVLLEGSADGTTWEPLHDTRGAKSSRTHLFVELDEPRAFRHIRLTGFAQPYGAKLAVSGLRVFGHGAGDPPAPVTPRVRRTGPLNAAVSWDAVPGAQGYNVRYGLAADKLYQSWLLYDRTGLDLSALNAGHDYWIAVDSFNENGITRGGPVHVAAV
ncbi:family 43 glycosylhydrolase [Actinoplanes rectilineatus]|uniref:family 43 glycosylhydrolase n=1 Tax=Actinoplanes rectilineatus TaxID=113571 RepID=UPI0005F2A13D|nr:family 43 glycosylhydrolase [Actinoplanes rectilineatus]